MWWAKKRNEIDGESVRPRDPLPFSLLCYQVSSLTGRGGVKSSGLIEPAVYVCSGVVRLMLQCRRVVLYHSMYFWSLFSNSVQFLQYPNVLCPPRELQNCVP